MFFYLACQRWKDKFSILLFLLYFSCVSDAPIDFSLADTHSEVSSMFTWVYMCLHGICWLIYPQFTDTLKFCCRSHSTSVFKKNLISLFIHTPFLAPIYWRYTYTHNTKSHPISSFQLTSRLPTVHYSNYVGWMVHALLWDCVRIVLGEEWGQRSPAHSG